MRRRPTTAVLSMTMALLLTLVSALAASAISEELREEVEVIREVEAYVEAEADRLEATFDDPALLVAHGLDGALLVVDRGLAAMYLEDIAGFDDLMPQDRAATLAELPLHSLIVDALGPDASTASPETLLAALEAHAATEDDIAAELEFLQQVGAEARAALESLDEQVAIEEALQRLADEFDVSADEGVAEAIEEGAAQLADIRAASAEDVILTALEEGLTVTLDESLADEVIGGALHPELEAVLTADVERPLEAAPAASLDDLNAFIVAERLGSAPPEGDPTFVLGRGASAYAEDCWTLDDGLHYCYRRPDGWVGVYTETETGYLWRDLVDGTTCEMSVTGTIEKPPSTTGEYEDCPGNSDREQLFIFNIAGIEWDFR